MTLSIILRLLGSVFLLASNAFFVATEFALTRLRQYDETEIEDDPGLKRAWKMTEKLEIYLTGCQVGITFSSVLLGIVAEPALTEILHPLMESLGTGGTAGYSISIVISIVVINLAHTVWAEQTPTYLGIEEAKRVARFCAIPHYYWTTVTYPFIFIGDWLTKATLKLFGITMTRSWTDKEEAEQGAESSEASRANLKKQITKLAKKGGISEDRQEEIKRTVEIEEIPVRDIMIPKAQAVCLSTQKSLADNISIVRETMKNRYPLVKADLDDFIGILYTPEILACIEELQNGDIILDDLDHYNMTVPAELKVSDLIDRFQSNRQELAVVTDDGNVIGMVTLTDALEVIIGSAEDPMDEEN